MEMSMIDLILALSVAVSADQQAASRLQQQEAGRGEVVLDCVLQTDRRFTGCRIVSETPLRAGFGAAALEQARQMRATPGQMSDAAASHERRTRLSFTFVTADHTTP
jgi:hypothetical protein